MVMFSDQKLSAESSPSTDSHVGHGQTLASAATTEASTPAPRLPNGTPTNAEASSSKRKHTSLTNGDTLKKKRPLVTNNDAERRKQVADALDQQRRNLPFYQGIYLYPIISLSEDGHTQD